MSRRLLPLALLLALFPPAALASPDPLAGDAAAVARFREGLSSILRHMDSRPAVFAPPAGSPLPPRGSKEELRTTFRAALDHLLGLEAVRGACRGYWGKEDAAAREREFHLLRAATLAQHRFALELLGRLDRHPQADVLLNEEAPEADLPPRALADLRWRFLGGARASETVALEALLPVMGAVPDTLAGGARQDAAFLRSEGVGTGVALSVMNAVKVVKDAGFAAWLPLQTGVSNWMGDVKVARAGRCLVSEEQARELAARLLPGDVLLERREWYLSNVGLPGYWKHAALYVGTAGERRRLFSGEEVRAWVREQGEASGDFETLLASRAPAAHRAATGEEAPGKPFRLIEAVGEGVLFTSAEHSLAADATAALRPRIPLRDRAAAVLRAFALQGRPYDFNFDFTTDAALVCTELVWKAYEGGCGARGLSIPLEEVAGRPVVPANRIVRLYDEEAGTESRQFDFVAFLDGREGEGIAVAATEEEFRRSWRRPNWHVITQAALPTPGRDAEP